MLNIGEEYQNVAGVYQITNTINGYIYIGCSNNLLRRIKQHEIQLRNNSHPNYLMQLDAEEIGMKSFELKVLEEVEIGGSDRRIDALQLLIFENLHLCNILSITPDVKMYNSLKHHIDNRRENLKNEPSHFTLEDKREAFSKIQRG